MSPKRQRKVFDGAFKARVVLEVLRGEKTLSEICLGEQKNRIPLAIYDFDVKLSSDILVDVYDVYDATWSPDGKQIVYSGNDLVSGQIVFKTSQVDGSNQKVLFTFGENPLERPSSIEKIEKLVWLK